MSELKPIVAPKPRLGDYYAGLSEAEWYKVYTTTVCGSHMWHLAKRLFQGDDTLTTTCWLFETLVEASDAFAFGALKYGVGNWREVSSAEHMQGAGRHFKALIENPQSKDDESGLLHEAHFLARAIMCLEQRRNGK